MAKLELRLVTLRYLLGKINLQEKWIDSEDYKEFNSRRWKNKFKNLRDLIEGEINQTQELLQADGIEHPQENFPSRDIQDYLKNERDLKDFNDNLCSISSKLNDKSFCLEMEGLGYLDVIPQWIFPTSTTDLVSDTAMIESFLESYNSDEDIDVDDLFINTIMSGQRVQKTFDFWKKEKQPNVSKRIPLIKEAIEAHIEGKFYLSVSALISQVEGLLRDALESMNRPADFGSMSSEDMRRATFALKEFWKSHAKDLQKATLLLDPLPEAVADLYDKFTPTVPGRLYRHGVYHGLQTDFGSKKNSLRLILLLDRIISFYT